MADQQQRRRHFRLRFPFRERPAIVAGSAEFDILEISEEGGRIESSDDAATVFGKAVKVRVRFRDGAEVATAAYILRHDAGELVLKFTRPIALKVIVEEQRRLIQKYPKDALRERPDG